LPDDPAGAIGAAKQLVEATAKVVLTERRLPVAVDAKVPELARAHLLYGEWLRREGRRVDAREQLGAAHEVFLAIGMEAFAERARRELLTTGEKVRKRSPETREKLTAQEEQIVWLACDGLSKSGDRRAAVHQRAHGPVPPGQGVRQARHQLAEPAALGAAPRPGHHRAAVAAGQSSALPARD
jgi:hypothetical protein